jgi:hypothetical protein
MVIYDLKKENKHKKIKEGSRQENEKRRAEI